MEAFIQWWRALAKRERSILASGLAVSAAALLYLLAFEPAWVGRQKVARELPQLRSQVAQMDALSSEARRISGLAGAGESSASIRKSVEASVTAHGVKPFLAQSNFAGELIELKFNSVPFALLIDWLDTTIRDTRVRIVDANISREAVSGTVSAKLALELPKREAGR